MCIYLALWGLGPRPRLLCQCGKTVCEVEQHANYSLPGFVIYVRLFCVLLRFSHTAQSGHFSSSNLPCVCVCVVTQELMSRTSLETQKLDLMDEVSYLKLKLVSMDETSSNAQTQDAASKEQNKAEVRQRLLA